MTAISKRRLPFLAIGGGALVLGLWAGLLRVGWQLPQPHPEFPGTHGPLMVCGFLGVVVILERAVALRATWALAAPVLLGIGSLALLAGTDIRVPAAAAAVASLFLLALYLRIVVPAPTAHGIALTAAAALWATGNILWLAGKPIAEVVYWWAGFLVLTIFAERRELSRVWLAERGAHSFVAVAVAYLAAVAATLGDLTLGVRLIAVVHLALLAWLGMYDPAPRALRQPGLRRFMAVCMLIGFVWLAVSALLLLRFGPLSSGPVYDAIFHAVFVGFVFSMIFAHGPVIVPSILGVPIDFSRAFYGHLLLLHASLIVRIVADLRGLTWMRMAGALGTATAIFLFVIVTAVVVVRTSRRKARRPPSRSGS